MADNTRVNELQDKLLKAMDILNAQALNSISFDKTITCKIENDKDKKDGKYEVNDGNRIFTAYSSDTRLRAGDAVYVTVPEGNFENQKMIIGKKTADNDKPFNFTQPFDTFFDMTGNIITPDEIKEENKELIANSIEDEDALIENCKTSTWLIGSKDTNGDIVMTDVSNKDLIKYTRLAVRADFRTWIKNAVRGEYGINIYLRTSKPKTVSAENNAIENNEQIIEQGDYKYNWNNSMMYGNTYNFETYYSQEIVLDLEKQDIGRVDGIAIEFYQKANFYDKFNEPIPSSEGGFIIHNDNNLYDRFDINGGTDNGYYQQQGNSLSPNIFIDNFYLSFGYDISTFTDDYVEIYTQNRNSYRRSTEVGNDYTKENQKEIKMRWVHLKDGNPIDMVAAAGKQSGETEPNYEVRWYRYSVGAAAADEYCGIYWIEEKRGDFNLIFNPDVNKQQEKIKAIVLCDGIPYRSNELIFENEEDLPPSKEAQHIMTALNIECEDNTNGNYLVYGQNRNIKDSNLGDEIRNLSLWFDADNNGQYTSNEEVQYIEEEQVVWYFPANNTMIKLLNEDKTEVFDSNGKLKEYQLKNTSPRYQIKKSYNTSQNNNTISCQYTLNGVVYNTEKTLTFGIAGTMGSEQTLVVDFLNDTNAIDLDNKSVQTYRIKVQLYDSNGRENTDLNNISWEWWKRTHEYLKLTVSNDDSSICNLQLQNGLAHGQLYILRVSVGNLETYFSIPLKSSNKCDYIEGPTEVIYQSNGEPDFYNYPYKIYNDNQEINSSDIGWSVISTDTNSINPGNYDATIQNNKLNPIKMFVKDAPFYGVKGGSNIGTDNEQIFWTQPIIVMQNRWPSNVINKWDGKTIEIDNGNGTILTQALAAGTKNSNNEFSGVMIGEWKHTDSDQKSFDQTGVFGFHEGAMSYAFKEDGTAFIGKDGKGRIHINGNDATIYSQTYNDGHGIKIDLNDPYLVIQSNDYKIIKSTSSHPFQIGSNFQVKWDGTIYATNGEFQGHINGDSGTIGQWTIASVNDNKYPGALYSDDKNIILNPNGAGSIILNTTESLISGGTIAGAILSSTSSRTSRIKLEGYFQLDNGGYIGEMESGLPGYSSTATGVGMAASGDTGAILATTANAGLRYTDSNYVTVANTDTSIGNATKIEINCGASGSENNKGIWIQGNSSETTHLHIFNIPAKNQHGIYARFA